MNDNQGFENKWSQTDAGKGWFSLLPFYGPTEPFFDKTWKLSDIEKAEDQPIQIRPPDSIEIRNRTFC